VVLLPHHDGARLELELAMALQAEVGVVLHQKLLIHAPVWGMANRATFAHRGMFIEEGSCLVSMALHASLVLPGHRQAFARLSDFKTMWVMALGTTDSPLWYGMMSWKREGGMDILVAAIACIRIQAWVDNGGRQASPGLNVLTPRTVTRLTTGLACRSKPFVPVKPSMRAGGKTADVVGMTVPADRVADIGGSLYLRAS
jgi:hypothetical protein